MNPEDVPDPRAEEEAARDEQIERITARLLKSQARREDRGRKDLPESIQDGKDWPVLKRLVRASGEKWLAFLKRKGLRDWTISADVRLAEAEAELAHWAKKQGREWPAHFSRNECLAYLRAKKGKAKKAKGKAKKMRGGAGANLLNLEGLNDDAKYQLADKAIDELSEPRKEVLAKKVVQALPPPRRGKVVAAFLPDKEIRGAVEQTFREWQAAQEAENAEGLKEAQEARDAGGNGPGALLAASEAVQTDGRAWRLQLTVCGSMPGIAAKKQDDLCNLLTARDVRVTLMGVPLTVESVYPVLGRKKEKSHV
jgi:hypothetical protein